MTAGDLQVSVEELGDSLAVFLGLLEVNVSMRRSRHAPYLFRFPRPPEDHVGFGLGYDHILLAEDQQQRSRRHSMNPTHKIDIKQIQLHAQAGRDDKHARQQER